MSKKITLTVLSALFTVVISQAQPEEKDTVIVKLANTSQVIFTINDRSDLDILKHYDFQHLFEDIIAKIENNDTTSLVQTEKEQEVTEVTNDEDDTWTLKEDEDEGDDDAENDYDTWEHHDKQWGRTWQSFNFDLGTNNYLQDGKFPDSDNQLYSVRPWGSWYLAINSVQRTRLGKNFFLEWGFGMSWYNFKFQKDNVLIMEDDNGVVFTEDNRDVSFKKSKLSISYLNASLVPVFDFGDNNRKPRLWEGHHDSFRIGIGPYMGYRVGSHSKLVYTDGGREKDKDRDNFYLENFRYGLRLQLGFRSTDLFFNYDMNELFSNGRGPKLNAFSFGVVF